MYKNILVLIIVISILLYIYRLCMYETFVSIRSNDDMIYHIGTDNIEPIYKYKNKIYRLINGDMFKPFDPWKIEYIAEPHRIPVTITANNIKAKYPMHMDDFNFRGLVANKYYKQYYILYDKEYPNNSMENKTYEYKLVKKIDDEYKIIHNIPPRDQIVNGDTIYFSYGVFRLGPLYLV